MSCERRTTKYTREDEDLFQLKKLWRLERESHVITRLINNFAQQRELEKRFGGMNLVTKVEELLNCVDGVWSDRDLMWRQQTKARNIYEEFHAEAIDGDQAAEEMYEALQLVRQDFHVPSYEVILDDFFHETGLKDIDALFAYVRSKLCEDAEEECMKLAEQCPKQ